MKLWLYYYYWYFRTIHLRWNFPKYNILSNEKTLQLVLEKQLSIARFGDGELRLAIRERDIVFQTLDLNLADRLNEILNSSSNKVVICLPWSMYGRQVMKRNSRIHWLNFINQLGADIQKNILDKRKIYGATEITRCYITMNNSKLAQKSFDYFKKIWRNRKILIVEGEFSRIGVGNDLFDDVDSIQRIICPSRDAYSKYQEIYDQVLNFGTNRLIIIALGPTATVLAYDLSQAGLWALDVGHIDVEYCWMQMNAKNKVAIKGKYVAESNNELSFELDPKDKSKYEDSIVLKIN